MLSTLFWQSRLALLAVAYVWGLVDPSMFVILAVQMQQQYFLLDVMGVYCCCLSGRYLPRLARTRARIQAHARYRMLSWLRCIEKNVRHF
jgi:hypothetical protein